MVKASPIHSIIEPPQQAPYPDYGLSMTETVLASVPLILPSTMLIIALTTWAIELPRKGPTGPRVSALNSIRKALLQCLRFEMVGMTTCGALVFFLCYRHRHIGFESIPDSDTKLWGTITKQWPYLMTADSLLSIQSMLRFVMLLSAVLRGGALPDSSPMALVPEAASFMLLASVCRLVLLGLSPFDTYHLDGPLGGAVYVIFEVLALFLLILLSHTMIYQAARSHAILAAGALLSLVVARQHQFNLADDAHLDFLFSMALLLELPAALSFLARSCMDAITCTRTTTAHTLWNFTHLMLPVQQGLSLYFLLVGLADPLETPKAIMRVGHPFHCMWVAGAAQVALYFLAATVYFISSAIAEPSEAGPNDESLVNV